MKRIRMPLRGYGHSLVVRSRGGRVLHDNLARVIMSLAPQDGTVISLIQRSSMCDEGAVRAIADKVIREHVDPDVASVINYDPELLGEAMRRIRASR